MPNLNQKILSSVLSAMTVLAMVPASSVPVGAAGSASVSKDAQGEKLGFSPVEKIILGTGAVIAGVSGIILFDLMVKNAWDAYSNSYSATGAHDNCVPRLFFANAGLRNVGNTCFYNALLQHLYSFKSFRDFIDTKAEEVGHKKNTTETENKYMKFSELFKLMDKRVVVGSDFMDKFWRITLGKKRGDGKMADIQETWGNWLDDVRKEYYKYCSESDAAGGSETGIHSAYFYVDRDIDIDALLSAPSPATYVNCSAGYDKFSERVPELLCDSDKCKAKGMFDGLLKYEFAAFAGENLDNLVDLSEITNDEWKAENFMNVNVDTEQRLLEAVPKNAEITPPIDEDADKQKRAKEDAEKREQDKKTATDGLEQQLDVFKRDAGTIEANSGRYYYNAFLYWAKAGQTYRANAAAWSAVYYSGKAWSDDWLTADASFKECEAAKKSFADALDSRCKTIAYYLANCADAEYTIIPAAVCSLWEQCFASRDLCVNPDRNGQFACFVRTREAESSTVAHKVDLKNGELKYKDVDYKLTAVTAYTGRHYYTYKLNRYGIWYKYNDSAVSACNWNDVKRDVETRCAMCTYTSKKTWAKWCAVGDYVAPTAQWVDFAHIEPERFRKGLDVKVVETGGEQHFTGLTEPNLLNDSSIFKGTVASVNAASCAAIKNTFSPLLGSTEQTIAVGGAIIYSSFDIEKLLPNAKVVIQAVGPMNCANRSDALQQLYSAYYSAFRLAIMAGCETAVVPSISMDLFDAGGTKASECKEFGINCSKALVKALYDAQDVCKKKLRVVVTHHIDAGRSAGSPQARMYFAENLKCLFKQ